MENFDGKIAVITGGGTGMGRELTYQLAAEGCHVSICDVIEENMEETFQEATKKYPQIKITKHLCDVSSEEDVLRFRDEVLEQQKTEHINLLFNNAGIGGGASFVLSGIEEWERTFKICWDGVYLCSRAFMDALLKSEEGHMINTSSVNGFWATLGHSQPHTSYSAAKFAVKGFTEALINDFRINAPHLGVSLVMPGHIGTSISENSGKVLGQKDIADLNDEELQEMKDRWIKVGAPVHNLSLEMFRESVMNRQRDFKEKAITSAEAAAKVILDGVKAKEWRILIGPDAKALDRRVRENPEKAYDHDFLPMRDDSHFNLMKQLKNLSEEEN
mgnify:FL=1